MSTKKPRRMPTSELNLQEGYPGNRPKRVSEIQADANYTGSMRTLEIPKTNGEGNVLATVWETRSMRDRADVASSIVRVGKCGPKTWEVVDWLALMESVLDRFPMVFNPHDICGVVPMVEGSVRR